MPKKEFRFLINMRIDFLINMVSTSDFYMKTFKIKAKKRPHHKVQPDLTNKPH